MFFSPIIDAWGVAQMAANVGLPAKTVREWHRRDSIPAEWFAPVVRAAASANRTEVTLEALAAVAERRRLAGEARKRQAA